MQVLLHPSEKLDVQCELVLIPLNDKPEFINQAGQGPSSDLQLRIGKDPLNFKINYTIPDSDESDFKLGKSLS